MPDEPASGKPSFVRWTHGMINRLVSVSDIAALVAAAGVAGFLLPDRGFGDLAPAQFLVVALTEIMVFQAVMWRADAYRLENYESRLDAVLYIGTALLAAWAASLVLLAAFAPAFARDMSWLLLWHAMQLAVLLLLRPLQRWLIRRAMRRRLLRRRVVVVGTGGAAEEITRRMEEDRHGGYDILGVFRAPGEEEGPEAVGGQPVLGDLEELARLALVNTIDVVVIALPWDRAPEIFRLSEEVSFIAADVVIPFRADEAAPGFAALTPVADMPALQVLSRPFKGTQGVLKVAEDYVVAIVALVLVSPIMLAAALAIRLEDGGPVLFRQWRPGFGRKPFAIYKFRTMKVNPADDARVGTTGPTDPRVTRVGAFLRRLSIDELPQLFNVLQGDMSVVGPRPYVADMLVGHERFSDLVKQYAERHRIKPGLTGYAQAYGMRSFALRSPDNARRSIEMDLHYMTHWSVWLDLRIMLRTLAVGLAGRHVF